MTDEAARQILVRGARALAHRDGSPAILESLLAAVVEQLAVESAVVVAVLPERPANENLEIVAAVGLGEPASAGLTAAMRNPQHPIARTVADPVATIDVPPTQPGGPALRSHVPLTVTRDGSTRALGVLALAHHQPLGAGARELLEAAADLAAVALERG